MEEKRKKKIIKISVFITSLFIIFLSVTYSFINQTLAGEKRQVITSGNLSLELQEDENNLTIQNAMPMYDEVGMIQDAFTFRLINKTSQDTNYILKLEKITVENPLDPSIVKYGFTKDNEVKIDFVSNIVDNTIDTGVIKGNQTIEYSLRLWIDANVENLDNIQQKRLSYKFNIEATRDTTIVDSGGTVNEKLFQDDNLGENCKTYNDGVDTFLVGECQNNYIWYSGKLWRVVLKNNETGTVKMITDNAITAIPYNANENASFENSYADQWLNQEFLPTLHDYQDYLVTDSLWDATLDDKYTPTRPNGTTIVNRAVGLLNAYEYYMTYNYSEEISTPDKTGFLKKQVHWCVLTPYSNSEVRYVYSSHGSLANDVSWGAFGLRPSVNLKSDVQTLPMLGNGTISSPYRLVGDEKETIDGTTLLNTRYSGEYVKFNNELYRVVDVEDGLTKIISVDKPTKLAGKKFHNVDGVTSFATANIKSVLKDYYTYDVAEPYKSMIETNTKWYLGTVANASNYKSSICAKVFDAVNSKANY